MTTVPIEPIKETASLRLFQFGEYVEDGVVYRIGPVITQAFLDANGEWVFGLHNALDPAQSLAIDGVSDEEVARFVAHFRRLAEVGESPPAA